MGWRAFRRIDRGIAALFAALALVWAAGWIFKDHCLPGGWTHAEQYSTGCYTDVVPFWDVREVKAGKIPYFQTRMEYPVLTGAQIWIEGGAARLLAGRHAHSGHFLAVVAIVNGLIAGLILWMMLRAGIEPRRLWAWAVAPPLVLYVAHNWDLAAAALAVAAMLAARDRRLALAAALAGLGTAAKLFPVLLLPLIGLAALFGEDRPVAERIVRATGVSLAAIGAWAVVNLPVALAAPENWSEFYRFSQERGGTASASWEVLNWLGWWVTTIPERNFLGALFFVIGAATIVAFGWRRHHAHLWTLYPPVLAWFMLTNKVYSPQFDLWLYPVLVMLAPRLWPVFVFAAADIAAYFAEFWWFASMEGGWPTATPNEIAIAASIRALVMLYLIVDCVRRGSPDWVTRRTQA